MILSFRDYAFSPLPSFQETKLRWHKPVSQNYWILFSMNFALLRCAWKRRHQHHSYRIDHRIILNFFFPVGSNLDIPGGARTASSWKLSSLNLLSASLFYIRSLKDFLFSELNAVQLLNVCFFGAQKKKNKNSP
jgi:hypothetical protein